MIEKHFLTDHPVWNYLETLQGKSEFIIKLIGYSKIIEEEFICNSISHADVFYEYTPHNLE